MKSQKKTIAIIGLALSILVLIASGNNSVLGMLIRLSSDNNFMKRFIEDIKPEDGNNSDVNTPDNPMYTDDTLSSTPYVNDTYGLSITPPKNWKEEPSTDFGSLVIFMSDKTVGTGDKAFVPNLIVGTEPAQGYNLGDYVESSIEGLRTYLTDYELLDNKQVTINGVQANILSGKYIQSGVQIRNMQLIYLKNDNAFIVTGTVTESEWTTEYENTFMNSFNTLKVN